MLMGVTTESRAGNGQFAPFDDRIGGSRATTVSPIAEGAWRVAGPSGRPASRWLPMG